MPSHYKIPYFKLIKQSVQLIYNLDADLFKFRVHEDTITHRIAYYFETLYKTHKGKYDIDVQYNKDVDSYNHESDSKSIINKLVKEELNYPDTKYAKYLSQIDKPKYNKRGEQINYNIIIPDLILHKRGTIENEVIVEVKKCKRSKADICYDLYKIKQMMEKGYKRGYFIFLCENAGKPIIHKINKLDDDRIDVTSIDDLLTLIEIHQC